MKSGRNRFNSLSSKIWKLPESSSPCRIDRRCIAASKSLCDPVDTFYTNSCKWIKWQSKSLEKFCSSREKRDY